MLSSRLAVVIVISGWLSACTSTSTVQCDNGTVCPASYTCAPTGCLSPEQLAACTPLADDDPCNVPGLGAGRCSGGACIVAICGNERIELDEACDDGNVVSGDGCSGTCNSDESCGNGVFELQEECDCGDADHPGGVTCNSTINGGTVCSETCKRRFCGNNVTENDEVCDDGNAISGDGCSFDCLSMETCANGILDSAAGEECDDKNTRNLDGCASNCRAEPLDWREVVLDTLPEARTQMAMTYDVARQRTVMFAGTAVSDAATWEFDGVSWRIVAAKGPPNASGYGMVYDANRNRVLLFGRGRFTPEPETWEFDGVSWTELTPAASPPARGVMAMAYDSRRKRIVVFGGFSGSNALNDTWEFDGLTWRPVTPTTTPPSVRYGGCAAYDPKRGIVVMFGGTVVSPFDETWEYNGATSAWTHRTTLNPKPPAMAGCNLVWDTTRNKIVLVGGVNGAPATWEYDGSVWAPASVSNAPAFRNNYGLAYDQSRKTMVMFGGFLPTGSVTTNQTFLLNNSVWSAPANTPPPPRSHSSMAYDVGAGKVVMFGGFSDTDETVVLGDGYFLDDTRWSTITGAKPTARGASAIAFDRVRGKVVLFGGQDASTIVNDTWELTGNAWSTRSLTSPPSGRKGARLEFDPAVSGLVMFGGSEDVDYSAQRNDTWKLNASGWAPITTTTPPEERSVHGMAYDETLGRCVIIGGVTTDKKTYELDSTTGTWTTAAEGPPIASPNALVYDPVRKRMVLFGGALGAFTWERAGQTWSEVSPDTHPPEMRGVAMAYDIVNAQVVAFGGYDSLFTMRNETWRYGFATRAVREACQSGVDYDRDGMVGCADDECWRVCTPLCPPGTTNCPTQLRCGDGVCSGNESCRDCPADCAVGVACPNACGDFFCDPGETNVSCPGDCP